MFSENKQNKPPPERRGKTSNENEDQNVGLVGRIGHVGPRPNGVRHTHRQYRRYELAGAKFGHLDRHGWPFVPRRKRLLWHRGIAPQPPQEGMLMSDDERSAAPPFFLPHHPRSVKYKRARQSKSYQRPCAGPKPQKNGRKWQHLRGPLGGSGCQGSESRLQR